MNLQVAYFQRCKCAFHQHQVWMKLQLAFCLLLLRSLQLYHLSPPLPTSVSSKCTHSLCSDPGLQERTQALEINAPGGCAGLDRTGAGGRGADQIDPGRASAGRRLQTRPRLGPRGHSERFSAPGVIRREETQDLGCRESATGSWVGGGLSSSLPCTMSKRVAEVSGKRKPAWKISVDGWIFWKIKIRKRLTWALSRPRSPGGTITEWGSREWEDVGEWRWS